MKNRNQKSTQAEAPKVDVGVAAEPVAAAVAAEPVAAAVAAEPVAEAVAAEPVAEAVAQPGEAAPGVQAAWPEGPFSPEKLEALHAKPVPPAATVSTRISKLPEAFRGRTKEARQARRAWRKVNGVEYGKTTTAEEHAAMKVKRDNLKAVLAQEVAAERALKAA